MPELLFMRLNENEKKHFMSTSGDIEEKIAELQFMFHKSDVNTFMALLPT